MMKKVLLTSFILIATLLHAQITPTEYVEYVVAVNESVNNDTEWVVIIDELKTAHPNAAVVTYKDSLKELRPSLKELRPRYLCVVDKPENIDRDFIIEGNRMSRTIDNDIYDDYIWGIITGYSPKDAIRIVRQSAQPFVLKTALSTITEVSSGEWFDKFAWVDDHVKGKFGEKMNPLEPVSVYNTKKSSNLLSIFHAKWEEIDPDVIITASHATQNNLEMPFSVGNIVAKDGQLYAKYKEPIAIKGTKKPRVYLPIGNCLIGDMNSSKQSMAAAFLSSGGSTAMLGYVVPTWYGRNGWGALKYFLANPGKHTLAEAAFLNRQDMLTQEYRKEPRLLDVVPDFKTYGDHAIRDIQQKLVEIDSEKPSMDDVGFIFDRDVVVYYGDPAWDVRNQHVSDYPGYRFYFEEKEGQYTITLKTDKNFSIDKASGKGFKEEHVKDIPLAYFFPKRIFDPIVIKNANELDIAFDENFLLIYNQNIEPNMTYKLTMKSQLDK